MIFSHISWQQYLKVLAILLATYYTVLFLKYYRKGIGRTLLGTRAGNRSPGSGPFIEPGQQGYEKSGLTSPEEDVQAAAAWDEPTTSDPILAEVNDLIRKIKAVVAYSASEQCDQRYVADTLQKVIQHYPGMKDDVFRRAVKRLIRSELTLYDFPDLTDEEMNHIWIQ